MTDKKTIYIDLDGVLNNYTILLFDKDNNQISAIGGSALGIIAAKDKAVSVVEFTDDISSVRRVEFVK